MMNRSRLTFRLKVVRLSSQRSLDVKLSKKGKMLDETISAIDVLHIFNSK